MRLKKESFILRELNKKKLQNFRVPKIISMQSDRIVMEKISPDGKPLKREALQVASELENIKICLPISIKLFNFFFDSSEFRIVYMATLSISKIGLKGVFLTLSLIYKLRKSQKKVSKKFLHNDGIYYEILKENNTLYLVDLESSKYECRWVLKDIISIYYIKNKKINLNYLRKKAKKIPLLNIKSQVRLFLLEYFFVRYVYYKEQFRFNVLCDKSFDAFYQKQQGFDCSLTVNGKYFQKSKQN